MMKILIAHDGSHPSGLAIEDLRRAGLPEHVEAVVLSVADVWLPPAGTAQTEGSAELAARSPIVERAVAQAAEALAAATRFSEAGAETVRKLFPKWLVKPESVADSPAWAIIKRGTSLPADLIVMGSHGHSPFTTFVFGSVSLKVVAEADCSTRIGRKGRGSDGPVRILAGLDGSVDADTAIASIASRFWPKGSEVRLLTSIDAKIATAAAAPGGPLSMWLDDEDEEVTGWVSRMMEDASARLRASGLIVSSDLVEGDPKRSLLREAETWGADSIFVGARGHSLFERLLLGSVSSAIVARAHCSVEIVRTKAARTQ